MRLIQVVVFLTICGTVKTSLPVKAAGYLVSAFTFGLDIYGFIDSLDDDKTHTDDSKYEKLKEELSNKIDAATNSIIANIDLKGDFNRLFEISKYASALLVDIHNIIESKTKEARDENIKRFKDGFKEHEADIQELSRLLTVTIHVNGLSKPLVDKFAEQVGCSLTSLQEFEDYYMNLVSNAFALDITNELFNDIDLSNQTKAFWMDKAEILIGEFKLRSNECISRFPQFVKDDLVGGENATNLQRKNSLRYSDKLNSVVYVDRDTVCDIKYLENDDYIFLNKTSAKGKIVFFERKNETIETLDHNSINGEDNCTKAFPTELDMSRLVSKIEGDCDTEKIGKMIDDMFFWRGYILRFRLIMDDKPQNQIVIDQSSRTIYRSTEKCGKDIVIAVKEWKTENVSNLDYLTTMMNDVAIVTVPTTLIFCLVISYLVEFIS